jgi:hypothetical protein
VRAWDVLMKRLGQTRYVAQGGDWGLAQFNDGKPADEAVHKTCFSCHSIVKDRDPVFIRYAP